MASVKDPDGVELGVLERVMNLRGLRVLEIGSGEGRMTFRYAGMAASVVAVEPNAECVEQARADMPKELSDCITFRVIDAAELAEPPSSFDLAMLSWSL